jgi:predicted  nucleic acid-binding Zn-ribbon protein
MLSVIEHLLVLQDRDRKIQRVETELQHLGPEREALKGRAEATRNALETAKTHSKQIESDRKRLELDADAKKQQIEKYSIQQFQTKKNEEYKALNHEIDNCKKAISQLEDQQLELMEQADAAAKNVASATADFNEMQKQIDSQLAAIATREQRLTKELADLKTDYTNLEGAVEEGVRDKYRRLRKQKGGSTVVGIDHSTCGGCHMKLPIQIVRQCQGEQEIVNCTNCGRILYYTREMDLARVD